MPPGDRMSNKKMFSEYLILLVLIFICCFTVKSKNIGCAHCRKNIYKLSSLEVSNQYWGDIPILHISCRDYIACVLAPNCDMTFAEYLEVRGWNPRHEKIKGKTWKEIVNK